MYITPYPTNLPGLGEARLFAIQAMIQASLADLNAALSRDALSPLTLTAGQVIIGDPELVPTTLICVEGGGKQDGTDMDIEADRGGAVVPRSDKSGYGHFVYTNIYVYIGPDELLTAEDDFVQYVQYRTVSRQRICDHLRKRVFNSLQGVLINLPSQELTTGTDFDQLNDAHIAQIRMGKTDKNPGGTIPIWTAHLIHQAWIA